MYPDGCTKEENLDKTDFTQASNTMRMLLQLFALLVYLEAAEAVQLA